MALRPLLQFQNPDSTRDMNDRFLVFNKGVFEGGTVVPGVGLTVTLSTFATIGPDGMMVREDVASTPLAVQDGVRNFIVLRSKYVDNGEPIVSIESLPEAQYLGDPDLPFLITFAVVDVPLSTVQVALGMIEYQESDRVDPLGRLNLRGTVANAGQLPQGTGTPGLASNREGDFYIVTGAVPEIYVWNGTSWVNVTLAQTLGSLLQEHIDNLSDNSKHLNNGQFEAVLGTTGVPSNVNRFVTSLDARIPTQDENDAMTGDPTINSGSNETDNGANYRGRNPGPNNQFTLNSKVFAGPANKQFAASAVVEIAEADGPVYVGKDVIGTAQRWFNIYESNSANEFRDRELINTQGRPCRVTGVFKEASLSIELDPSSDPEVDELGFWRIQASQGNPGGSLFLQISEGDVDGQADRPFRIKYAKRISMETLAPQQYIMAGPQSGNIDARVAQLLETTPSANFRNSEWDGGTSPGDVIAYDSVGGMLVQHDLPGNLFPIGIRGNWNNLITSGLYEFPAPTAFTAGDDVYADGAIPGALTVTPNDRYIGQFLDDTRLMVNMNAIGLTNMAQPPGTPFPGGLFDAGLNPGEAAMFHAGLWREWDDALQPAPVGIRGNSNNIITNEAYIPGGAPYISGTRYYASTTTPGALTTTANDFFVGLAVGNDTLMVQCLNREAFENTRAVISAEHNINTGVHELGSARAWAGAEAGLAAASGGLASSTGMIYYATDTGRVFYCSDGATNTWIEQNHFTGPVEIDTHLLVEQQLRLPLKQITDNAADNMNPFAHAARHLVGGEDPLSGVVNMISAVSSDVTTDLNPIAGYPIPGQTLLTLPIDYTGRPGDTTILIFSQCWFHNDTGSSADITYSIWLDGSELLIPDGIRGKTELSATGGDDDQTATLFAFKTDVTAAAHTLEFRANISGSSPDAEQRMLMVIDLGLT